MSRVASVNRATDLNQSAPLHFDANSFVEAITGINQKLAKFNFWGTRSGGWTGGEFPERVYPGLTALGGATHTIADFYAHTNWVELYDSFDPASAQVPTFDDVFDPRSADYGRHAGFRAYLNKNPVRSGTFGLKDLIPKAVYRNPDPNSHTQMSLDELRAGDPRSRRLFPKARDAAVRATAQAIEKGAAFVGWKDAPLVRNAE